MLKVLLLLIAAGINIGSAYAQPVIDDFAFLSRLSESDQPLQRVELPIEVLMSLTRNDLGDVQVFDSTGKLLPSWVRQKPTQKISQQEDLVFHQFSTFYKLHSKTISTRQIQNQHNQSSEFKTTETIPIHSARHDYIIELTEKQRKHGLKYIQLQWKHEPSDQMLTLRVEVGKDLDKWKTLHTSKNLSNQDSRKTEWIRIEGIPRGYNYIRLIAVKTVQSFDLQKVSAVREYTKPVATIWHSLAALQRDKQLEGFYRFTLPQGLRPHQMRLKPVQQQSFIKGDLYASNDDFNHKITIKRGWQQHSFNDSNVIQASKPLQVRTFNYKNWWFYSGQTLENPPEIEIGFAKYEMLFLNNNNGPFTLAWGNLEASPPANDLLGILGKSAQEMQGELVSITDIEIAGGASRLKSEAKIPWLKWLLWLLLFMAVLITAWMALTLYRDMNTE